MKFLAKNLKETDELAGRVLEAIIRKKEQGKPEQVIFTATPAATIVELSGNLGSGKTAFVKAIARRFGINEITSPTFVIEKIYRIGENPSENRPESQMKIASKIKIFGTNPQVNPGLIHTFTHLIHIDAYRLENGGKELKQLGWDKIVADPSNLIFIEWPEKVADIIPESAIKLSFRFVDEQSREISFPDYLQILN